VEVVKVVVVVVAGVEADLKRNKRNIKF